MRILFFFLALLSLHVSGQILIPYSQFYLHDALYNPAATGLQDQINVSVLGRKEWTSFPGAPQSNAFIADMPLNYDRLGVGVRVSQYSIVANDNWEGNALLSYKINMGKGRLVFGMSAGLEYYKFNTSRVSIRDEDDVLLTARLSATHPSAGFGMVYTQKSFLAGLSALNLIAHPDNAFNPTDTSVVENKTYCAILVKSWILSDFWDLKLNSFSAFRHSRNPYSSLCITSGYRREIYLGVNAKTNRSVAFILNVRLSKLAVSLEDVLLGYSYDMNCSGLNKYLNNTHELTLHVSVDKPRSVKKQKQKPVEISPYDL